MPAPRRSLGPWTTSLDNNSRLELSAFWRRRMDALAALPHVKRRVGRRVLFAAAAAGTALIAAPLVQLAPANARQAGEEQDPAQDDRQRAADEGSEMLRRLARAGAPLLAKLSADHGYALGDVEMVRRVAPPFPPERLEWYRAAHPSQAAAIPRGPESMLFRWEDGVPRNWGMSSWCWRTLPNRPA